MESSALPAFAVPDFTEPIIAARSWRAVPSQRKERERHAIPQVYRQRDAVEGHLASRNGSTAWPFGDTLVAECDRSSYSFFNWTFGPTGYTVQGVPVDVTQKPSAIDVVAGTGTVKHRAPDTSCRCGIYAMSDPLRLIEYCDPESDIFGVVELSGRIIPGDYGWRAEKARIRALIKPWGRWRYDARLSSLFGWRNRAVRSLARAYGVPILNEWPELTDPKDILEWTSAKSSH